MLLVDLVRERFAAALNQMGLDGTTLSQRVTAVRDPQFGDYQANLAMGLTKQLGIQDPMQIAQDIVNRADLSGLCEPAEIAPRGFINLRLQNGTIAKALNQVAQSDRLAVNHVAKPRTYIIDYSSPNVAKPMHVGHIRSTVIGDSIAKVLKFLGHKVITDNHLGDWGTQFGMIIYGYKHFLDQSAFAADPVPELSRLYRVVHQLIEWQNTEHELPKAKVAVEKSAEKLTKVQAELGGLATTDKKAKRSIEDAQKELKTHQEKLKKLEETTEARKQQPQMSQACDQHPGLETKVLQETAKLHAGDAENKALWNQFLPLCLEAIHHIYTRLDIQFDMELGESYFHDRLGPLVQRLLDNGMAKISEGAVCVFLDGFEVPMLIRKQDGAYLYATTDLATIEYRVEVFQPDAILYVVDHRQGEHFSKLFATAKQIGYRDIELKHVSFGTVLGKDGKPYKTRSGSVVGLEPLLDEAIERAFQVVESLPIPKEEKLQVAQTVGLGAIKYADLVHNRTSDYEFDLEKMVRLDGHTSAYIQYSYARTCSILRNAGIQMSDPVQADVNFVLDHTAERTLALMLLKFAEVLLHVTNDYMPNLLADYLYDVSKSYSSFFEQCPVLKAETEALKLSRLGLCQLTGRTIKRGLELLGINVVDRM
jgi:arginyl-tRNA synthetase